MRYRGTRGGRCCGGTSGATRRGGLLSGGCHWTAGWLGLPSWVVLAFFVILFLTIGWPALLLYLACGLLLRPEAATRPATSAAPFLDLTGQAREVRDRTQDLEARIAGLESHVTSREFDFDRRLADSGRAKR